MCLRSHRQEYPCREPRPEECYVDVIGPALRSMGIATGEAEEEYGENGKIKAAAIQGKAHEDARRADMPDAPSQDRAEDGCEVDVK